jgi:hypothetical protein
LRPPIWNKRVWLGGKYQMAAYYHETVMWTKRLSGTSTNKSYHLVNESKLFGRERLDPMDEQLFYRNSPYWMAWSLLHKDELSLVKRNIPIPDATIQFQFSHAIARHLQYIARLHRNKTLKSLGFEY